MIQVKLQSQKCQIFLRIEIFFSVFVNHIPVFIFVQTSHSFSLFHHSNNIINILFMIIYKFNFYKYIPIFKEDSSRTLICLKSCQHLRIYLNYLALRHLYSQNKPSAPCYTQPEVCSDCICLFLSFCFLDDILSRYFNSCHGRMLYLNIFKFKS